MDSMMIIILSCIGLEILINGSVVLLLVKQQYMYSSLDGYIFTIVILVLKSRIHCITLKLNPLSILIILEVQHLEKNNLWKGFIIWKSLLILFTSTLSGNLVQFGSVGRVYYRLVIILLDVSCLRMRIIL